MQEIAIIIPAEEFEAYKKYEINALVVSHHTIRQMKIKVGDVFILRRGAVLEFRNVELHKQYDETLRRTVSYIGKGNLNPYDDNSIICLK